MEQRPRRARRPRRRCRSCSRAAASARQASPGSGRCGFSCRDRRPASSAAWRSGRAAGDRRPDHVDIGGTSCDIALISNGKPLIRAEGVIGGYPVRVPMVDVNAIGAGGGSIAWLDAAGALRVGPQSAGSEPGSRLLRPRRRAGDGHGRLARARLSRSRTISPAARCGSTPDRARQAIETAIARPMGLSVERAALGIHRVLSAQMAEAIRLVSIGRGIDPRGYTLLPLGGAGPVHAAALAAELGIRRIVVPPHPGVLSAAGPAARADRARGVRRLPRPLAGAAWDDVRSALARLDQSCAALSAPKRSIRSARRSAMPRMSATSVRATTSKSRLHDDDTDPLGRLYKDFLAAHDRVYGHATEAPARFVNLRSVHRVDVAEGGAGASTDFGRRSPDG